jgi:hypothetical protein
MLTLPPGVRVFVATARVDGRKGIDGLSALVRSQFAEDPLSGSMYVFFSRRSDRVRVLYFDRDGYVLITNQPSSHCTSFRSALRALFFARGYSHCGGSIRKSIPSAAVLRRPS